MSNLEKFYNLKDNKKGRAKIQELFDKEALPSDFFKENVYGNLEESYYKTLLEEVAEEDAPVVLRILLQNSKGITQEEYMRALQYATVHGNIGTTRVLLKHGVIPDKDIFKITIQNCHLNIFELLVQYVDFNKMKKGLKKEVENTLKSYESYEGSMRKANMRDIVNIEKINKKYFSN